jgi:hypothetical protein
MANHQRAGEAFDVYRRRRNKSKKSSKGYADRLARRAKAREEARKLLEAAQAGTKEG